MQNKLHIDVKAIVTAVTKDFAGKKFFLTNV